MLLDIDHPDPVHRGDVDDPSSRPPAFTNYDVAAARETAFRYGRESAKVSGRLAWVAGEHVCVSGM